MFQFKTILLSNPYIERERERELLKKANNACLVPETSGRQRYQLVPLVSVLLNVLLVGFLSLGASALMAPRISEDEEATI